MIYRNSYLANEFAWSLDEDPQAKDVARQFLRNEHDLLQLARVAPMTVSDLEAFLRASAESAIAVYRSAGGRLLITVQGAGESLFITGKTAEVLWAYIDNDVVTSQDRVDMTIRRQPEL